MLVEEERKPQRRGNRAFAASIFFSALFLVSCNATVAPGPLPTYKFENGNWYNGRSFEKIQVYAIDGTLSRRRPEAIDDVIDLNDGYVIPALGDAHSHRPSSVDRALDDSEFFLASGIFYVMNHGSLAKYYTGMVEKLEIDGRIDATFANAILSSSQSHSVELWQRLVNRGAFPDTTLDNLDGEAYFIIETTEDLERKWPEILASRPDFIKIMLQYADEYPIRRHDIEYFGHSGLDPMLVPEIVKRAHAEGLRVSAHIESASDFRVAVANGVDIVAHLPGYDVSMDDDIARYSLSEDDAAIAAKKDVIVLTTTLLSVDRAESEPARLQRMLRNHAENLRLLSDAGVRLGVGSDQFSKNSIDELLNLASLGVFDNGMLLKLICCITPRAIFPNREVGSLADGAEASFLVLDGNPLDAIENITKIRMRVKDGVLLPSQ